MRTPGDVRDLGYTDRLAGVQVEPRCVGRAHQGVVVLDGAFVQGLLLMRAGVVDRPDVVLGQPIKQTGSDNSTSSVSPTSTSSRFAASSNAIRVLPRSLPTGAVALPANSRWPR